MMFSMLQQYGRPDRGWLGADALRGEYGIALPEAIRPAAGVTLYEGEIPTWPYVASRWSSTNRFYEMDPAGADRYIRWLVEAHQSGTIALHVNAETMPAAQLDKTDHAIPWSWLRAWWRDEGESRRWAERMALVIALVKNRARVSTVTIYGQVPWTDPDNLTAESQRRMLDQCRRNGERCAAAGFTHAAQHCYVHYQFAAPADIARCLEWGRECADALSRGGGLPIIAYACPTTQGAPLTAEQARALRGVLEGGSYAGVGWWDAIEHRAQAAAIVQTFAVMKETGWLCG